MIKYIPLLFLLSTIGFSQQYEDVVYLKDGSVIRGLIVEQIPNKSIKIKSGKNLFVYQIDEIEKLTKEIIEDVGPPLENKTWSVQFGLGNHRNYSLLGISKDIKFSENLGIYFTASIGTPAVAIGSYLQSNYNKNGINLSAALGLGPGGRGPAVHSVVNYQWKINKSGFFLAGVALGILTIQYYDEEPPEEVPYLLPVIGYDFRF